MKKIAKKITAATMAAALVMSSITCMSANAAEIVYPERLSWDLHKHPNDSKTSQSLSLVTCSNGYNAYISSKTGDCSVNYVTISAPYTETRTITEKGENYKIFMKPSKFEGYYVRFTVKLTAREGSQAFNGGIIETV